MDQPRRAHDLAPALPQRPAGLIRGGLRFVTKPGNHHRLVLDPAGVRTLGQALRAMLHGKGA